MAILPAGAGTLDVALRKFRSSPSCDTMRGFCKDRRENSDRRHFMHDFSRLRADGRANLQHFFDYPADR